MAGMAAPWLLASSPAHAGVAEGDRLVKEDAKGTPAPMRVTDLRVGKATLVYPFDAKNAIVRNESRLNKIVLLRLPEAELDPKTKARAAGGVIAYSAICTHQGCDADTWLPKEKTLFCGCHGSRFLLLEGGIVSNGPATHSLPNIPLALDGDLLVIAGPFSATPGGKG